MKTGRSLKMRHVLLYASIFALSGCGSVKIHDDPWCVDAGKFGAECFYTISNKEFSLDKWEWDQKRVGQICSATDNPGEGFIHLKNAIEKLCANAKCTVEEAEMLRKLTTKINSAMYKSRFKR